MKRQKIVVTVITALLILLVSGISIKAWADDAAKRTADWKRAAELFTFYYQNLNSKYSFEGHEEEYLNNWKKWREDLTAFRAEFQKNYGKTADKAAKKFEGVSPPQGVGNSIRQICNDLLPFDFDAKEKEIAGWAAEAGDKAYTKWKKFVPPNAAKFELKVDYARRALASYEFAASVDPDGKYGDRIEKTKNAIAESEKEWKKAMAELKWPGHNKEFRGSGDPDDLAEEALKLMQSVKSWSKPEYDDKHFPVAACVTGKDWEVYKSTPLTRIPTQYSLNVMVAFAGTKDPDIAYVYHMVFYTKEEQGVKKEPPFYFVNSRQYAKHKMLMSNVPKMVDAGTGAAGSRSSHAGFFGILFRLALTLVLIATGLVLAENFSKEKIPQIGSLLERLGAMKNLLGWAVLVVGIVCFLRTALFYFSPFTDLLPQLIAVFAGLILVVESLPPTIADKIRGFVKILSARGGQLGIAAVLLGLIHLIVGGLALL